MGELNVRVVVIGGYVVELYFNELSIRHRNHIEYDELLSIVEIYKWLKIYNVNTCRIEKKDQEIFLSIIEKNPKPKEYKDFYFSFFQIPFESQEIMNIEEQYYQHDWFYKGEKCLGLAVAYLTQSICFSIYHKNWDESYVILKKDDNDEKVKNISTVEHVKYHFSDRKNALPIELLECEIPYSEKKIHLREDHGIDKLKVFADKVLHSPYVIEVVNSLPYNPHGRKFIKDIKEDGLIELVLPWTDQGLGLVVKTTGKSKEETRRIAQILEEKYGYL